MIDHHVDRPGVEAQQCVKLTGPNRPTGSTITRHAQHAAVHRRAADGKAITPSRIKPSTHQNPFIRPQGAASADPLGRSAVGGLDDLVALAGGPHPIPSRTRP